MKYFFKVMLAESRKQHRNYFSNKLIYVSLFLWPFLSFMASYYSYKVFDIEGSVVSYISGGNIMVFLLIGYMGMSFFRSVVQSAWHFSFERQSGTLEYIYLSPASRMAVILGNALSSVFEGSVAMAVFGALIILYNKESLSINVIGLVAVIPIFLCVALLWGAFLNVKVPVSIFPGWARVISCIFPLTYALEALRQVMLNSADINSVKNVVIISLVIILVLLSATLITIHIVEKHMRKTGNVILF